MKKKSPYALAMACLASFSIALPAGSFASPAPPVQRAGEISKVIPTVNIDRGGKTLAASAKTEVDWQDAIRTQASARARVALDDGSVLNVGSDSTVQVVKHDAGAQQTDLEVGFGKIRSQAQKISKSGGKFEVRTAAGVAGVVGTDFFVGYENNVMTVIVFEGVVKTCNLANVCVQVKAGEMTTVRNGDSSGPAAPNSASPTLVSEAIAATSLNPPGGAQTAHHISKGTIIALAVIAAVPAIVIPIVVNRGTTASPNTGQCGPNNPQACR